MRPAYNAAYDVAAAEFAAEAESPAAEAWCPEAATEALGPSADNAAEAFGPRADKAADAFGPSAADIAAAAAAADEPPGDIAARVIMSLYC